MTTLAPIYPTAGVRELEREIPLYLEFVELVRESRQLRASLAATEAEPERI